MLNFSLFRSLREWVFNQMAGTGTSGMSKGDQSQYAESLAYTLHTSPEEQLDRQAQPQ